MSDARDLLPSAEKDVGVVVRAALRAADELDAWDGHPSVVLGGVSPGGLVRWALIEALTPCDELDALCDTCLESITAYTSDTPPGGRDA